MTQMLDDNNWKQLKDQLQQRSNDFGNDDLKEAKGPKEKRQQEQVMQRLEKKTGKTRAGLREEATLSKERFESERDHSERRTALERLHDDDQHEQGRDAKAARKGYRQSR